MNGYGEATLNRTFHLSPNETICTIARMKAIHYLFYTTSKLILSFRTLNFRSNVTAAYHSPLNCTIARYYLTMTSQFVEWSIYFISPDPVSSNQMTRIYIGE